MKMKKIAFILFITLLILSCNKEKNPLGPDIDKIFGPFKVISPFTISQKNVSFSNAESIIFTAQFAAYENWELRITGLASGSYKYFEGSEDIVQIEWNGSSSTLPVLKAETCEVIFSVPSENYSVKDTIVIQSTKVNSGVLVTDFESGVPASLPHFYQSGVNFYADNIDISGQGDWFFKAGGTVPWDYLIGLIEFPALYMVGQTHYPLSPNQHSVYFNTMVQGSAQLPESFFIFRFYEDDNSDGIFDETTEDSWTTKEIYIDHDEWKLFSIPYDSLNLLDTEVGNGIPEPEKLISIEYLLLIDPAKGEAKGNLDYIIFTEGGPLEP